MRVLIVEDDDIKRRELARFVLDRFGVIEVIEGMSFQSGMRQVRARTPDLILLDMSIPTFDHSAAEGGGRLRPFGGYDFLFELDRRAVESQVIVVTQFESFGSGEDVQTLSEVSSRLEREFPRLFRGAVFYQPSESSWKTTLASLLQELGIG